jgi:hypothetical protein
MWELDIVALSPKATGSESGLGEAVQLGGVGWQI